MVNQINKYSQKIFTKKNDDLGSTVLTFDQSSAIKGFLMLLIILGHNHILAPIGGKLFVYIYEFHIYGFFILPFLYDKKSSLDKISVINILIKNWIPYIFFFLICYFIYHIIVLKDSIIIPDILYGLFTSSAETIKKTTGFYYLWFMPAYAAMSIVLLLYNNTNKYVKIIILLLGFGLYINYTFTGSYLFNKIPLAFAQGFYYFTFGFLIKLFLKKIPNIQYIGVLIFIVISILYWNKSIGNVYYLFPISGFLFIFNLKKIFAKVSLLISIGKYSFPIYLLHVIIYNFLEIIFPKTILFGFLDFIVTIAISMFIGYWMLRIDLIRKFIFPKGWDDFKSLFVK